MAAVKNSSGLWEIHVGGKIVAFGKTNREAWREYDRWVGEPASKAEDTSDWIFRKSLDTQRMEPKK